MILRMENPSHEAEFDEEEPAIVQCFSWEGVREGGQETTQGRTSEEMEIISYDTVPPSASQARGGEGENSFQLNQDKEIPEGRVGGEGRSSEEVAPSPEAQRPREEGGRLHERREEGEMHVGETMGSQMQGGGENSRQLHQEKRRSTREGETSSGEVVPPSGSQRQGAEVNHSLHQPTPERSVGAVGRPSDTEKAVTPSPERSVGGEEMPSGGRIPSQGEGGEGGEREGSLQFHQDQRTTERDSRKRQRSDSGGEIEGETEAGSVAGCGTQTSPSEGASIRASKRGRGGRGGRRGRRGRGTVRGQVDVCDSESSEVGLS